MKSQHQMSGSGNSLELTFLGDADELNRIRAIPFTTMNANNCVGGNVVSIFPRKQLFGFEVTIFDSLCRTTSSLGGFYNIWLFNILSRSKPAGISGRAQRYFSVASYGIDGYSSKSEFESKHWSGVGTRAGIDQSRPSLV